MQDSTDIRTLREQLARAEAMERERRIEDLAGRVLRAWVPAPPDWCAGLGAEACGRVLAVWGRDVPTIPHQVFSTLTGEVSRTCKATDRDAPWPAEWIARWAGLADPVIMRASAELVGNCPVAHEVTRGENKGNIVAAKKRAGFVFSLACQCVRWLRGESDFASPLSARQWRYVRAWHAASRNEDLGLMSEVVARLLAEGHVPGAVLEPAGDAAVDATPPDCVSVDCADLADWEEPPGLWDGPDMIAAVGCVA